VVRRFRLHDVIRLVEVLLGSLRRRLIRPPNRRREAVVPQDDRPPSTWQPEPAGVGTADDRVHDRTGRDSREARSKVGHACTLVNSTTNVASTNKMALLSSPFLCKAPNTPLSGDVMNSTQPPTGAHVLANATATFTRSLRRHRLPRVWSRFKLGLICAKHGSTQFAGELASRGKRPDPSEQVKLPRTKADSSLSSIRVGRHVARRMASFRGTAV